VYGGRKVAGGAQAGSRETRLGQRDGRQALRGAFEHKRVWIRSGSFLRSGRAADQSKVAMRSTREAHTYGRQRVDFQCGRTSRHHGFSCPALARSFPSCLAELCCAGLRIRYRNRNGCNADRRDECAHTGPGRRMSKVLRALSISMGVVAFCGLTVVGGCTQTSDGSVEFTRPPFFGLSRRPGSGSAIPVDPPDEFATTRLPPPSARPPLPEPTPPSAPAQKTAERVTPEIRVFRPSIKPPFARADPSRLPSCRNEPSPTGRIRVVCQ
jgi:hypothetical protein